MFKQLLHASSARGGIHINYGHSTAHSGPAAAHHKLRCYSAVVSETSVYYVDGTDQVYQTTVRGATVKNDFSGRPLRQKRD